MFLTRNNHLRQIDRVRIPENRDLVSGLRMDRNERVADWPEDLLPRIFASKPGAFLAMYPDSAPVYQKLSQHLGVAEAQIMLTAGIDGAIKTLFELVSAPGDRVAVLAPTYAMYQVYANLFEVTLDPVPYREDLTLDFCALYQSLEQGPSMVFVPNPNQPIEGTLTIDQLRELAEQTRARQCLLVIDEAYHGFGSETAMQLVDEFPNVVVMRTFSKAFGVPSIRTGVMVSSEDNMDVLAKTRYAHEGNALSYAVVEYLLDNPQVVADYVASVNEGREYVKRELECRGYHAHGDMANYLFVDCFDALHAKQIVDGLRERAVYIKGPWSAPWRHRVSITVGPVAHMQRFLAAFDEVTSPLKEVVGQ